MRSYPLSLYRTPEEVSKRFKEFWLEMFNVVFVGIFSTTMLGFVMAYRKFGISPGGTPLVVILGAIAIIVLIAFWAVDGLGKKSLIMLIILNAMFIAETNYINMWNEFQSRPTITHNQAKRLYTKAGNLNLLARTKEPELLNKYPTRILETEGQLKQILDSKEPVMFVFFKVGCPYCENAHNVIMDKARSFGLEDKVVFVNYESEVGIQLEYMFHVDKVTTIITKSSGRTWYKNTQSKYKDGVRQLEPDEKSIQDAFTKLMKAH